MNTIRIYQNFICPIQFQSLFAFLDIPYILFLSETEEQL
jgi:hypothetical protein